MKEIKLSCKVAGNKYGERNFSAIVDDIDYNFLCCTSWQVKIHGRTFYARRTVIINGLKKTQMMHRVILGVTDPNIKIDHRDRDGLNNTRGNMRICTQLLNGKNRRKEKSIRITSVYKGVSLNHKKFVSRIRVDGKLIHLGRFYKELDAAKKYNEAAIKYFGEYAQINVV